MANLSNLSATERLAQYPLVRALLNRRSRRFAKGMTLNGGPLTYASQREPEPLTLDEEAALTFAAGGITGPILGELPYQSGDVPDAGNGNILMNLMGRTVASGDASHAIIVFVMNDQGCWMMKRPQDYPRTELPALVEAAHRAQWTALYEKGRIQIANQRLDVPRQGPYLPAFNKWSANVAGTTYFLPIAELTGFFINILLAAFSEESRFFLIDERNNYQPAGIAKFGRSKGGHLNDDPSSGFVGTLGYTEDWLLEFTAIEQGGILQNLALVSEALGVGGFAHFAAYPHIWFQALGFRMVDLPFSRTIGAGPLLATLLKLLKRDLPTPTAVGLEREGQVLIKPFCPPYYRNMEEAVLAFLDTKFRQGTGIFRDGGGATAWQDAASVQKDIPNYTDKTIAATIACCDYLYKRYGRMPPAFGPFRSVLAFQAHHLDRDFYDKFYRPEALAAP
jgi:hypothetical protein